MSMPWRPRSACISKVDRNGVVPWETKENGVGVKFFFKQKEDHHVRADTCSVGAGSGLIPL